MFTGKLSVCYELNPSINALCVVNDIRNVEEFLSNMRRGFNKAMGISRKEIIFNLTPGVTTKRMCNISTNAKSILETYSYWHGLSCDIKLWVESRFCTLIVWVKLAFS